MEFVGLWLSLRIFGWFCALRVIDVFVACCEAGLWVMCLVGCLLFGLVGLVLCFGVCGEFCVLYTFLDC